MCLHPRRCQVMPTNTATPFHTSSTCLPHPTQLLKLLQVSRTCVHPFAGHVPTEHWTLAWLVSPGPSMPILYDPRKDGVCREPGTVGRGVQGQNQLPELQGCCAPARGGKAPVLHDTQHQICSVCHPEGKGEHIHPATGQQWASFSRGP